MKKLLTLLFILIAMASSTIAQNEPDYLCFEVEAGTTISIITNDMHANPINIQYSFDKVLWNKMGEVVVNSNCCVYFKGNNPEGFAFYKEYVTGSTTIHYHSFRVSKPFKCSGNIMTLINENGTMEIPCNYCFYGLFENCPLITAPELPATTLKNYCYHNMFYHCKNLIVAPKLPATKLNYECYKNMFAGCSSLTQAPVLPATSLAGACYSLMFAGCSSLIEAPDLSATSLAPNCYQSMFGSCTSLVSAPKLPATVLYERCYYGMFGNCTSLKIAPELPATTLAPYCYEEMFKGCNSLTQTPKLPASILEKGCYQKMFKDCINLKKACLPASSLASLCYELIFSGCSELELIVVGFTMWNKNQTRAWVQDIPKTGRFYCPSYLSSYAEYMSCQDVNYFPDGWTRIALGTKYSITTEDNNITVEKNKTEATIVDEIQFKVKDRTTEGCILSKVYVNESEILVENFKGSFNMIDYAKDVTIRAEYRVNDYSITTDHNSLADKEYAKPGDVVNVSLTQKIGYQLPSVTMNDSQLKVKDNYQTSFVMPAHDVKITSYYKPIKYKVSRYKYDSNFSYIRLDQAEATVENDATFHIINRTQEGYALNKIWLNDTEIEISGYDYFIDMKNYLQDVEIKIQYSLIAYPIIGDEYIQTIKQYATIDNNVTFTVTDRTTEGYKLDKVLINGLVGRISGYSGTFYVKNYINSSTQDIRITAEYSKIAYNITADEYSNTDKTTATIGDLINVSFSKRDDSELISATYNGNPLSINNYTASFTMPAQNVEIKTEYKAVYEVKTQSDGVSVSQPTAKAGDEISITVTIKDGYTAHLYVNGVEVTLNGNLANYIMPSGKIEIKVEYVADPKTPVSEVSSSTCTVDVFPNPAKSADEITIKISGSLDVKTSKILIYNSVGSIVKQIDNVTEYNRITLKSGVYTGVLITRNGKKTFRVVVR